MLSNFKYYILSLITVLFACQNRIEDKFAFAGKKYGGVLTYFSPEKTSVFFPLYSPSIYSQRVLNQIFEPLFTIDNEGKIIPNLAKSIKINENGKSVTIKLRSDVYFHNDNCFSGDRKMKAADVKFSLDYACSGNKWNSMGRILRDKIKGGHRYYTKSSRQLYSSGVRGIKVIDDTTIQISLTDCFTNFEKLLAHSSLGIFSKKAYDYYKEKMIFHPVGTGPFLLKSSQINLVVLERNSDYWKKDHFGNQLPFLSEIHVIQSKGIKNEYEAFSKQQTDIIFELPIDQLNFTFGSLADAQQGKNLLHRVIVKKGTKINYLSFDCTSFPFSDARVRKAFSLAIDRKRICVDVMKGEGNHNINGFVPENSYYKPNRTELLKYEPERAQKLMKEAGYKSSNPFPNLIFYVNAQKGGITDKWSKEIKRQLKKNLGINLTIKYCSLSEKHKAILSRKAKLWKSAWIPDYPDAEAYFRVFYGNRKQVANQENNYNNFNNALYDKIFQRCERMNKTVERAKLLNLLDKILMDEAVIVPIFSEDLFVIVNLRVRDFEINNFGFIDFSKVYIKELS
jgi:peptide/nickel transport system substrate-binding protein